MKRTNTLLMTVISILLAMTVHADSVVDAFAAAKAHAAVGDYDKAFEYIRALSQTDSGRAFFGAATASLERKIAETVVFGKLSRIYAESDWTAYDTDSAVLSSLPWLRSPRIDGLLSLAADSRTGAWTQGAYSLGFQSGSEGGTVKNSISDAIQLAGIGVLITVLFMVVGRISSRKLAIRHEQFESTIQMLSGMRNISSRTGDDDAGDFRPSPEARDAISRRAPLADGPSLAELIDRCGAFATRIDLATGRRNACRNVADLVYKLSLHLGSGDREALMHYAVSLVYDIGFLKIDPAILKSGTVTDEQFVTIKTHARLGLDMIRFAQETLSGADVQAAFADGVSKHHENLDGSGYPGRLKGQDVPLIARLIRVSESYIALVSNRSYKKIMDRDEALADLRAHPERYDLDVVRALEETV